MIKRLALFFLALILVSCAGKAFNFSPNLIAGMDKEQTKEAFGDHPDSIYNDSANGTMWVYYNREWGIIRKPEWGTKYLFFDLEGKLYRVKESLR